MYVCTGVLSFDLMIYTFPLLSSMTGTIMHHAPCIMCIPSLIHRKLHTPSICIRDITVTRPSSRPRVRDLSLNSSSLSLLDNLFFFFFWWQDVDKSSLLITLSWCLLHFTSLHFTSKPIYISYHFEQILELKSSLQSLKLAHVLFSSSLCSSRDVKIKLRLQTLYM